MKRFCLFLSSLIVTVVAMAESIDRKAALQKAQKFMPGKEFVESKTILSTRANAPQKHDAFYVFNAKDGDGYVIVSGDDRTTEILGYSKHGNLDTDNLPENLKWWLDCYASQIKALGTSLVPAKHHANMLPSEAIVPLIKSTWNQNDPYNHMCPDGNYVDYDEPSYDAGNCCSTGCVATAMAQVMYYWKWPETCPALDSYKIGPFIIKALPATTFEWDKMKDSYDWDENGPAADAVAKLMRYCGQAVQMYYSLDGSSAGLSSSVLTSVFKYSPNCHEIRRNSYSTSRWESVIYDEIAAHRPVLYSGINVDGVGHQFIVDGYDGNGLFHFNWGWGGLSDSYYVLSLSDQSAEEGLGNPKWVFQYNQSAFVGVKPAEPGEMILPILDSQINFLTPTTTYTRVSADSDFVGVSLEGSISALYTLKENVTPIDVEIGWGLLQEDDEIILKLDSTTISFSPDSWWETYNAKVSFGSGLADGKYHLCHIYRYVGETEWKICENNYGSQLWAEVKDNSMIVRVPNNENFFKVNNITTYEPVKDEEVKVTVNVTNTYTEATVALTVGLWLQKDESPWKNTMVRYFDEVGYGGTGDIVLSFLPKEAGTYNLKITSGGSDEALGFATVIVADVDTLSYDGLSYKCIPDYYRAKVIRYQEDDNNYKNDVNILTSLTCNGVECKVTAIDDEAFYNCQNTTSLTIPEGVKTIGKYAFEGMYSLKKLELPASLEKIGERILWGNFELNAIISHIMEPFTISNNAFCTYEYNYETGNYDFDLPSPATLYVPFGTKAKYEALLGWTRFANIEEGEPMEKMVDGLKYSYSTNGKTASVVQDESYELLTEVTIPSMVSIDDKTYQVTEVGNNAFLGCSNLSSLTLPEGLLKIGNSAFLSTGILEINLPSTLKELGNSVFNYCSQIKTIVIPEGLETIGDYTFANMDALTKLELPASLKRMGGYVVSGKNELTTVVSNILEPFAISDYTFGITRWNDVTQQWSIIPSPATLYVPFGSKAKYESLSGWKRFANIEEGEMKEMMVSGLKYTYGTGGTTATVIQDDSYKILKEVSIPSTVVIEGKTYHVRAIGNRVFYNCSNLSSLKLSEGLEKIGNYALTNTGIHDVILPTTLKSLGDNVFNYCSHLKKIVIPEGVETIGNYTFAYMDGLTELELPASLKEIGWFVIVSNGNLKDVVSHIMEPFAISDYTFVYYDAYRWNEETQQFDDHLPPSPATLHVPIGTKAKYESLSGWTRFANIEEDLIDNGIATIVQKNYFGPWYNLQGIKVAKPQKGIYVINGKKYVVR